MAKKNWELIKETDVSPSKWFPLYKHEVRLPDGRIVDDYYLSKLGDVSMVVAITRNNQIVFVRQYKHGAGDQIIELPAGRIKEGQTQEEAAINELKEETGFVASKAELIGKLHIAPSKDTAVTNGFLIKDVHILENQELDENEDIEVVLIPINQVDEKIKSGEIYAADTIAMIKLAQLKFPEVFAE